MPRVCAHAVRAAKISDCYRKPDVCRRKIYIDDGGIAGESARPDSPFFDRFRPSLPSRAVNCANIFCRAQKCGVCSAATKSAPHVRDFTPATSACRRERTLQKILISSQFLQHRQCARGAPSHVRANVVTCKVRARYVRQLMPNAHRVHVSLSGTLFFSCCCSKRNTVCVDSRRALMRHPPCYMARRAAMAKRRKKAAKAAKKTKKRKKKL
jgi:hypothetical protein